MTTEVLYNRGRETVDEIVVTDCTIHLEQMTDTSYWMGIYKDGETRQALHVRFGHRGRCPLEVKFFDDSTPATPWVWDDEDEHL